jgi:hypothetical protein
MTQNACGAGIKCKVTKNDDSSAPEEVRLPMPSVPAAAVQQESQSAGGLGATSDQPSSRRERQPPPSRAGAAASVAGPTSVGSSSRSHHQDLVGKSSVSMASINDEIDAAMAMLDQAGANGSGV